MQEKYPQKPGLDFILKQAFYYWNKTLLYQLMFSIIYFTIFLTVFFYFSEKYGIIEQFLGAASDYMKARPEGMDEYKNQIALIMGSDGFQNFYLAIVGVQIFLYPLNLGLFQIFRKLDLKEQIVMGDLFTGYNGLNFFRYISYFIFWFFFYTMIAQTIILPFVWVMITLFVAPLMFFQNKTIFEGIALNWKALKLYFIEILVCVIVAFLFKYIGFTLFLVGGLLTLPFWNAIIYSLYKTIFDEKS
ncbi:hypothetical protein HIO71_17705 [Chryseobacterium aquaticum]|uniref:Beta-carotene 15,15'-monooxygenase n=1 Tax=Chryseobacterium aquaticum TaxID=452084 RepID=A0A848NB91_9FLAO|nr:MULTISPECIES: hypothetical protein [Chryseobacterium]NMR36018.1 hypothetical protein [Chryseobacterium aquaticum]NRQ48093.1 hypothetical protein [Chryseobacterium sp. C-204]